LACRAANPVAEKARQKISVYSNVPFERVISLPDSASIYMIPAMLREVGLDFEVARLLKIEDRINLRHERKAWAQWCDFTDRIGSAGHEITIGVTGKYTSVRDSYASIINALEHAGIALSCSVKIKWIDTTSLTDANWPGALTMWTHYRAGRLRHTRRGRKDYLHQVRQERIICLIWDCALVFRWR